MVPTPLQHPPLQQPLAGYLGPEKTLARITDYFYWPGICAQVQCYCSACRECQLHQGKDLRGEPHQPMPLVYIPFERVSIDIVGPVVQPSSCHKFLLVLVDYATRYPEDHLFRGPGPSSAEEAIQMDSRPHWGGGGAALPFASKECLLF